MQRIDLTSRGLTILGLALAIAATPTLAQKVEPVTAPRAVREAFEKKFPGFKITAVKKEVDAGKPVFEIESTKDGMTVDALLKPDGTFLTVEKQIKEADLPAKVASAVKAKYSKAKWTKVEEITTSGKVTYEVAMEKPGGGSLAAVFDEDGKFIEEE